MKNFIKARWIGISAAALVFIGVGQVFEAQTDQVRSVAAQTDLDRRTEALARKSGCLECHGVDRTVAGPVFKDIAARYTDDAGARDALFETVKQGGKGNWTQVSSGPMPPYMQRLSDDEIKRLVDWVLSL